jgi:hypothetical protein
MKPFLIGLDDDMKLEIEKMAKEKNMARAEIIRIMVEYMMSSPIELEIALSANKFRR